MYADKMLAVVEPYFKSLETGRRMSALAKDLGIPDVRLVANKVRDERELEAVREFAETHDLELGGVIPFDDRMPGSERASASPIDFDADAEAVRAIGDLARRVAGDGEIPELVTSNGRGNERA
jgi:CO dehydrogenase maturation factor